MGKHPLRIAKGPLEFFLGQRGCHRTTNLCVVFNAIQYMLNTRCKWRAITHCFSVDLQRPPFQLYPNWREWFGLEKECVNKHPKMTPFGIQK